MIVQCSESPFVLASLTLTSVRPVSPLRCQIFPPSTLASSWGRGGSPRGLNQGSKGAGDDHHDFGGQSCVRGRIVVMEHPVVLAAFVWPLPPHVLHKPLQDVAVEFHIDRLTWRDEIIMDSPCSVEKDQRWLHVAFCLPRLLSAGVKWPPPLGWCCLVSGSYHQCPSFITSYGLEKEVWVISDLLKFHADFGQCFFWSSDRSLGTNFAAVHLMLSSADIMGLHVPYDSPTMLQTSWIIRIRSWRVISRTFATFSAIMPIEVRPERSSSSTDIRPFLNPPNFQILGIFGKHFVYQAFNHILQDLKFFFKSAVEIITL